MVKKRAEKVYNGKKLILDLLDYKIALKILARG